MQQGHTISMYLYSFLKLKEYQGRNKMFGWHAWSRA